MTLAIPSIVPIVEGQGDQTAAPVLLRRVLHERMGKYDLEVKRPMSAKGRGTLVKRLEDFLVYAERTPGCVAILVLVDADQDCPRELGLQLANRARAASLSTPAAIVCAKPAYENWFLASDASFHGDAEAFGGAKDWLTRRKPAGLAYRPTRDQAALSKEMDIDAALHDSRSFRRLCSALDDLVACICTETVNVTPPA